MKKRFFVILILVMFLGFSFFLSANPKKSNQELLFEDINYFNYVFENCYVVYDDIKSNENIKIDNFEIIKQYKKNVITRKIRHLKDSWVNGINQDALLVPLWKYLHNLNIDDGHLKIKTNTNSWSVANKNRNYRTEYYFEKKGNNFFVKTGPNFNHLNAKFTGNVVDLKPSLLNGKELYMNSRILNSYKEQEKIELELNSKKTTIPAKYQEFKYRPTPLIQLIETDKSVYLRCATFDISPSDGNFNLFNKTITDFTENAKTKNYIILDLIGNSGGYLDWCYKILNAINGNADKNEIENLNDFITKQLGYEKKLQSLEIAKKKYEEALKIQDEKYIELTKKEYENQKVNPHRYYASSPVVQQNFTKLPQYEQPNNNATIIVLMDNYTSSAAEVLIAFLYAISDKIILLGENSRGSVIYGGILSYKLPHSQLEIRLASTCNKNMPLLKFNEHWHGENFGFYPDYWITENNLADSLFYLSKDDELKSLLEF